MIHVRCRLACQRSAAPRWIPRVWPRATPVRSRLSTRLTSAARSPLYRHVRVPCPPKGVEGHVLLQGGAPPFGVGLLTNRVQGARAWPWHVSLVNVSVAAARTSKKIFQKVICCYTLPATSVTYNAPEPSWADACLGHETRYQNEILVGTVWSLSSVEVFVCVLSRFKFAFCQLWCCALCLFGLFPIGFQHVYWLFLDCLRTFLYSPCSDSVQYMIYYI